MKNIHSKDPRKKKITDALKRKSGGTKVTLLTSGIHKDTGEKFFHGRCLKRLIISREWQNLGFFKVTPEEAGVEWEN